MIHKKYKSHQDDQTTIERYILRSGGTPAWREVQKSLVGQCIGMIGKPLSKTSEDDILKARDKIFSSKYRPNYQRRLVLTLRNFFLWYGKQTNKNFTDIEGIKLPRGQWKTKCSEDMLSPEDVEKILKAARNSRDRAFLAMLWDGSNRPIELLNLSWHDIKADSYGYFFITSAKTGKERHIRLTISIPYLEEWKRNYPGEPTGDAPVFVTVHKVEGEYPRWNREAAAAMIKELRKDTGIKKMKLSIFRPSRITYDVKSGYDLAYVMMKNWGNLKTSMIDLYTNTDASYVDQIALRQAGMARVEMMKEKEQYKLEVPECPVCHTLNPLGGMFCTRCQGPLTEEAMNKVNQAMEQAELQPEYQALLNKFKAELMQMQAKK